MICKYCHEKNHLIDNCPNIICKKCNKQGHPQWLCSDKKYDKKHKNNFDNNIDNNINNINNNNNLIPKSSFERKQNSINTNNTNNSNNNMNNNVNNVLKEEKNISYYLKLEKERWGNIIFNE
jgi:hypothetical protein